MPSNAEEPLPRSARAPRRLGILGGSFDPPHLGHLHAARTAREAFELDEVRFIPAARPPHKPGRRLADGEHRVALLELLLADEPDFFVDSRELSRAGPSFTVETLRELAEEDSGETRELFMILGTDNLPGLPDWRDVEEILRLAQPIVIHRDGEPERLLDLACAELSRPGRERLRRGLVFQPPVAVSSTELRGRLEADEAPGVQLPEVLRDYIRREGLYLEPT